jgi:thiol-disulfide isomerase/thioredoxin
MNLPSVLRVLKTSRAHALRAATALTFAALCATAASAAALTRLPAFSLPDLDGRMHAGSEFAGKVVVVDFWATWCATCKETIPRLADMQKKFKDKGLSVVGISVDKGSDRKIARTGEKLGVNYLVLRDQNNALSETFGFKGIPSVYVFGRTGELVLALPGYDADQEKTLQDAVAKALNTPAEGR